MTDLRDITRREFIRTTQATAAGLIMGFGLPREALAATLRPQTVFRPNGFLQVGLDGQVTIWSTKSEMGQGVKTALPMIVAEELDVDWMHVTVVQADLGREFGDQTTASSQSVRGSWAELRAAGATARAMLVEVAARAWGVPADECQTRLGIVSHPGSGRTAPYGDLAAQASELPIPEEVSLKDPAEFRLVGTSVPRVDTPSKVHGSAIYGIDVRVPGMLYAVVARCPVFGGRLVAFDDTDARRVSGVRGAFEVPSVEIPYPFGNDLGEEGHQNFLPAGVAVVADSTWAAMKGREALRVTWDEGPNAALSTQVVRDELFAIAEGPPGSLVRDDGNVEAALEAADSVLEAEYELPFQAHAPMEPVNCTAHSTDSACELWAPTQIPDAAAAAAAHVLGLSADRVTVHVTLLGGGFGRRLGQDYAAVAALVSRAAGAPVKVVWTREDDIQGDYYRQATFHRIRAGLDGAGQPVAWHHRFVSTSISTFYMGPDVPWADADEVRAEDFPCHTIPNYRLEYSVAHPPVRRGWWRSVEQSFHAFATESFIDELAVAAGMDPVDYRLRLIGPPRSVPFGRGELDLGRLSNVIEAVAERSAWGTVPPAGRARGIAARFSFGSYVAQVAEVTVVGGAVRVHRVWCVVDAGTVVNPNTVQAQMEGAIVFGLTATLKGEITHANGRVQQSNFHDYPMLRMDETPVIDVHIVQSNAAPGGIGEPGVPPIGPAVANAVHRLTGVRVRRLPIRPSDLGAA